MARLTGRRRARPEAQAPVPRMLIALICVNVIIEVAIESADLIGRTTLWREVAFYFGAFWPQMLRGAPGYYPGQAIAMFFTYAFLHGGALHLLVNMVTLWSFGRAIIHRVGWPEFLSIYLLTAVGGAVCYALLGRNDAPMVGASGALFGLAGVWICWSYLELRLLGRSTSNILRVLLYLVLYNLVFWFLLQGRLAWETHLGGFLAGWCYGWLRGRPEKLSRKRRDEEA
jgi:rhomboid protease GluP